MAQRSTVAIIVLILVLLFSLLYLASFTPSQDSNALYTILEGKKANASLQRLKIPEPICFTLDDENIRKYAFLSALIREADGIASEPAPPSNTSSNRYDGFGMSLEAADTVPLIQEHHNKFNYTITAVTIRNYTDETHTFDCNFDYKDNQYYLNVRFQSLTAVNDNDGFVPIEITNDKRQTGISRFLMYYTFNNTAVWTNHLDSFVTLTLHKNRKAEFYSNHPDSIGHIMGLPTLAGPYQRK